VVVLLSVLEEWLAVCFRGIYLSWVGWSSVLEEYVYFGLLVGDLFRRNIFILGYWLIVCCRGICLFVCLF
jgi:hypothetical protein